MVSISSVAGTGPDCTAKDEQEQVGSSEVQCGRQTNGSKGRRWNVPVVQVLAVTESPAEKRAPGTRMVASSGFQREAMSELMTCGQEDMGKACSERLT